MRDLLTLSDLRTQFETDRGTVKAVDGIDLTVREGETVGLVGESGSGKSVTALSAMDIVDEPGHIAGGEIRFGALETVTRLSRQYPKAVRTADSDSGFITIDAATVDRNRVPDSVSTTADDRTLAEQFIRKAPKKALPEGGDAPVTITDGYVDLTAAPER